MQPFSLAVIITLFILLSALISWEDFPRSKRNLRIIALAINFIILVWVVAVILTLASVGY